MKKRGLILIIFLAVFTADVFAVGLVNPKIGVIPFTPGYTNSWVFHASGASRDIAIIVSGNLAQYVTVSRDFLPKNNPDKSFVVSIALPETLYPPGKHSFSISLEETISPEEEAAGLFVLAANVKVPFYLEVPFKGKYLTARIETQNLNVGEKKKFRVLLENKGLETIKEAYADFKVITIQENTTAIPLIMTEKTSIGGVSKAELEAEIDAGKLQVGDYMALARIHWDGNLTELNGKFKVGSMDVLLLNHTKRIEAGQIRRFEMTVKSGWNSRVDDVRIRLSIAERTVETPSISLAPWEEKTITGYFDARELREGAYNGTAELYFGSEMKTLPISIHIFEPPEPQAEKQDAQKIYVLVGVVVIAMLIVLVFLLKAAGKGRKGRESIEAPEMPLKE